MILNLNERRISELPKISNLSVSLSGPFEMIYSLISYPQLLFSKNNYSPILCASALKHIDPRMVMLFKSYGQHLEFWLMTQILTPTKTYKYQNNGQAELLFLEHLKNASLFFDYSYNVN